MQLEIRTTTNGHWHTAWMFDASHPERLSLAQIFARRYSMASWSAAFKLAEHHFGKGKFWFTMIRRGFYKAEARP